MAALNVRLNFQPAHGLNMRARRIISEDEQPARRWPDVTRVVSLYLDVDGDYAAFVCFRPAGQIGNVDKVRCYRGKIGPATAIADPLKAVGGFAELGQLVEDEFAAKLTMFFGEPGEDEPVHWHAM